MKQQYLIVGVAALALLTGCGGGGDGSGTAGTTTTTTTTTTTSTASAVDKYVGTWSGCFAGVGGSFKETITITKSSDTVASYSFIGAEYASADCSGTSTGGDSGSGTATMVGTKTIGSETVDKVDMVESSLSEKQVLAIVGAELVSGVAAADGGTVDADGYPNTLNGDGLTKQ